MGLELTSRVRRPYWSCPPYKTFSFNWIRIDSLQKFYIPTLFGIMEQSLNSIISHLNSEASLNPYPQLMDHDPALQYFQSQWYNLILKSNLIHIWYDSNFCILSQEQWGQWHSVMGKPVLWMNWWSILTQSRFKKIFIATVWHIILLKLHSEDIAVLGVQFEFVGSPPSSIQQIWDIFSMI
jgi:hypothetical protein